MSDSSPAETSQRTVLGLGPKISLVMVSVLVALGVVTTIVVASDSSSTLRTQYMARGAGLTSMLEISIDEFVSAGRQTALSERLRARSDLEGVRYIVVVDTRGVVVASSFPDLPPDELVTALAKARATSSKEQLGEASISPIKIAGYDVLDVNRGADTGTIHVGMDVTPIGKQIVKTVARIVVIFFLFTLIGAASAILAGQLLVRPLYALMKVSKEVSAGNLKARSHIDTRDEFATFGQTLNAMVDSLRTIVDGVRSASTRVSGAAAEILMSSQAQETGVAEQTASIDEVTHSMMALTSTAHAIAGRSQDLSSLGERMSAQLRGAQEAVDAARVAMREIAERNGLVSARVQELHEHGRAIISVIDIIESISDRLDLLALNAALEGARAGDVGKGFSLVAQEMRRLAESVMTSTREVKGTVGVIGEATRASLDASRDSAEATKHGVREMETMVQTTSAMFDLIENAVTAARQIFQITQQQLASSEQVSSAMSEITEVSTNAAGLSQEVTRAATSLSGIASVLEQEVAAFRVNGSS